MSVSARHCIHIHHVGLWWFADLSAPDPYFILPVTSVILGWCSFEVSFYFTKRNRAAKFEKEGLKFVPLVYRIIDKFSIW